MARTYQQKQNEGNTNDSNTATKLGAKEINSKSLEITNAVESAGLTPSAEWLPDPATEDFTQLAQSLWISSVSGRAFIDGGTSGALYDLTAIGSWKLPPAGVDYAPLAGATVSFIAANTNTAPASLRIGPSGGPFLPSKPLYSDATVPAPLEAGTILAGRRYEVFYDPNVGPSGAWLVIQKYTIDPLLSTLITFEKPSGEAGGEVQPNTWTKVPLSDIHINQIGIPALVDNEFVLEPGKYTIVGATVAQDMGPSRARLWNVTNGVAEIYSLNGGVSENSLDGDNPYCYINETFVVIGSTKTFRLEIYGNYSVSPVSIYKLGVPVSIAGVRERYGAIKITTQQ